MNEPDNKIGEEITDWVAHTIEIVASVSFNLLKEGTLAEEEIKNYTAKNILLNMKEFVERFPHLSFESSKSVLDHINTEIKQAIGSLIKKYPQNNAKKASLSIKKSMFEIDNRSNDTYDFLYANGFSFTYKENGDYSSEILTILNEMVKVADKMQENEMTLFEQFNEFFETLFKNSHELATKDSSLMETMEALKT